MRPISLIIIHCSAVGPGQTSTAAQIDAWHKARGYHSIGYHFVVRRSGEVETGRPLTQVGAHCLGHNAHSIGICYEGGLNSRGKPADTRTTEQRKAMLQLIRQLKQTYPNATIYGHNHFAPKACPCFDAHSEYAEL